MKLEFNKLDREAIDVTVPIEYSVRNSLIQDLLMTVPHKKMTSNSGTVQLKFSNSNFKFDSQLIEKLALMKYQVFPVLYFTGKNGDLQQIVLDSWKKKYDGIEVNNVSLIRIDNFTLLFAIKPGSDNIQMNIDVSNLLITYKFTVHL